jgi:hypothetical protein
MANCNLCPPGSRAVPDERMAEHLRSAHPEVDADGTRKGDDSTIVGDMSLGPAGDGAPGDREWHS